MLCGEPAPSTGLPVASVQIILNEFHYDELNGINLLWNVDPCIDHYTCNTLLIYETVGDTEVQIESSPLHCNSRLMRDRCTLPVTIPSSIHLQLNHNYRYCVALLFFPDDGQNSIGPGCSDVILLEDTKHRPKDHQENRKEVSLDTSSVTEAAISAVHVNVSNQGFLQVYIGLINFLVNGNLLH